MTAIMRNPPSAEQLVERAKSGDREAFDRLVTDLRDRLRSSVSGWSRFQLGPRVDVEDVVQETFSRAYRSLANFECQGSDSFFRWLCGIAKRVLAQTVRESRGRAQPPQRQATCADAVPSPSKVLRREERFERLQEALSTLSPEHREAILLCRIEGLTSAEVAERMNRSPAAVRQLLVRAMRELKRNFGDTESLRLPNRRFTKPVDDHDE